MDWVYMLNPKVGGLVAGTVEELMCWHQWRQTEWVRTFMDLSIIEIPTVILPQTKAKEYCTQLNQSNQAKN